MIIYFKIMYTSRENSNLATLLKYTLGKINISKTFYIIRLTFGCMDFKCVCSQKCFIKYICKIQSLNSVLNHLIFQNFPINLQNENYIKQYLIFIFLIIKRQNQRVVQVKTLGNLTLSLERRALNNNTDSQITEYKHISKIKLILERLSLKQEVITMQNDDNHNGLRTPNESFFSISHIFWSIGQIGQISFQVFLVLLSSQILSQSQILHS